MAKQKYLDYCRENQFPCETIENNFNFEENQTISLLINFSQNHLSNNFKNTDSKKQRLFELVEIFARLTSIDVIKIKKIQRDFVEFDYEILRFFALTNSYSIRNEKLIRRIKEFSQLSIKIKEKLTNVYEEEFGKKQSASINTSSISGHCILVSGDDLDELKKLLETIKERAMENEINVYTNGALFLAHFYPYFINNKILKGHYDTNNVEYDFSTFFGPILITQNFIQKIDTLYRGEIFSNKIISYSKVLDIKNDDYNPIIDSALNMEKCQKKPMEILNINYNRKKILDFIEKFNQDEIVIISGMINEKNEIENYENKKIIRINCPLENDILIDAIKILKEKNIKITIFFAQCNFSNLSMMLSLLNQEINLNTAKYSFSIISPYVFESLREDFQVSII